MKKTRYAGFINDHLYGDGELKFEMRPERIFSDEVYMCRGMLAFEQARKCYKKHNYFAHRQWLKLV